MEKKKLIKKAQQGMSFIQSPYSNYSIPTPKTGPGMAMPSTTPQGAPKSAGLSGASSGGGFGSFMSNPLVGQAVGSLSQLIPGPKPTNSADQMSQNIRNQVNQKLLSGAAGPWGMLAGAVNMGIDKTGGFTSASKGLGSGTDTANFIASLAIPGAGWFAKKTKSYDQNQDVMQSSGFSGVADSSKTAKNNASAKLMFGRSKANAMIDRQLRKDTLAARALDESNEAKEIAAASSDMLTQRNMNNLYNSDAFNRMTFGKNGMKIESLEKIRERRNAYLAHIKGEDVKSFANGGVMNVIVNGKLHSELNGVRKNKNFKDVDITKKGVPIITFEDGGDIEQHAEVERDELILTLELTKALETFKEVGDDDSAIEAGKLLAYEIVKNTKDSKNKIIKNA